MENYEVDLFDVKMADGIDEDSVLLACSALLAASAGIGTLLCAKRKHSAWVKEYIRERRKYGVFYTLLPELAEKEVLKCMQYLRMDIHIYTRLKNRCRMFSH